VLNTKGAKNGKFGGGGKKKKKTKTKKRGLRKKKTKDLKGNYKKKKNLTKTPRTCGNGKVNKRGAK